MHELAVTQNILKIVLNKLDVENMHVVTEIVLEAGELRDIEELWVQKYFDYISHSTKAEGAKITVEKISANVECCGCSRQYHPQLKETPQLICPFCGSASFNILTGRELTIKHMKAK